MPRLSIIVPVYNAEDHLERCIDSILNQTYSDFEVILVNDGSKDRSGEICDAYAKSDSRVKTIHQENSGQSIARNRGINIAKGSYIGFVDSDDWIDAEMYTHLFELVDLYACDIAELDYDITDKYHYTNKTSTKVTVLQGEKLIIDYLKKGMQKRKSSYPVWNKIYNRYLFNEISFAPISLCEDYLINFQLFPKANMLVRSNQVGYFYFQSPESTVRGPLREKDLDIQVNCETVYNEAKQQNLDAEIIKLTKEKLARNYFSLISKAFLYGVSSEVKDDTKDLLKSKLKSSYWMLMKSFMPFNRKLFMTILVILDNFRMLKLKKTQKKLIFKNWW